MRYSLKTGMIEATRLTRAGRLIEAMAAIRRSLAGGAAAPSESEPRTEPTPQADEARSDSPVRPAAHPVAGALPQAGRFEERIFALRADFILVRHHAKDQTSFAGGHVAAISLYVGGTGILNRFRSCCDPCFERPVGLRMSWSMEHQNRRNGYQHGAERHTELAEHSILQMVSEIAIVSLRCFWRSYTEE